MNLYRLIISLLFTYLVTISLIYLDRLSKAANVGINTEYSYSPVCISNTLFLNNYKTDKQGHQIFIKKDTLRDESLLLGANNVKINKIAEEAPKIKKNGPKEFGDFSCLGKGDLRIQISTIQLANTYNCNFITNLFFKLSKFPGEDVLIFKLEQMMFSKRYNLSVKLKLLRDSFEHAINLELKYYCYQLILLAIYLIFLLLILKGYQIVFENSMNIDKRSVGEKLIFISSAGLIILLSQNIAYNDLPVIRNVSFWILLILIIFPIKLFIKSIVSFLKFVLKFIFNKKYKLTDNVVAHTFFKNIFFIGFLFFIIVLIRGYQQQIGIFINLYITTLSRFFVILSFIILFFSFTSIYEVQSLKEGIESNNMDSPLNKMYLYLEEIVHEIKKTRDMYKECDVSDFRCYEPPGSDAQRQICLCEFIMFFFDISGCSRPFVSCVKKYLYPIILIALIPIKIFFIINFTFLMGRFFINSESLREMLFDIGQDKFRKKIVQLRTYYIISNILLYLILLVFFYNEKQLNNILYFFKPSSDLLTSVLCSYVATIIVILILKKISKLIIEIKNIIFF